MRWKLSPSPQYVSYSVLERKIFTLLPQREDDGITFLDLIPKVYDSRPPFYARQSLNTTINNLASKITRNKEPFRIIKSERNGPHPIEWRVEAV